MREKNNNLHEPEASYGRTFHLKDLPFTPVHNLKETLKAQGYISHSEFVEKLSKYD